MLSLSASHFDLHIIGILQSVIFLLLFVCACVSQVNWMDRARVSLALPHTYTLTGFTSFKNFAITYYSGLRAYDCVW